MLEIRRNADGRYSLIMPTPILSTLRGLPVYMAALLQDPSRNKNLVARLFPRTYDDDEHEVEHRMLLEKDLLDQKREALAAFERVLDAVPTGQSDSCITLEASEFDPFLIVINDVRVLLGVDLGIESDRWDEAVGNARTDKQKLFVLQLLTYIEQELLVATGTVDADPDIEDNFEA